MHDDDDDIFDDNNIEDREKRLPLKVRRNTKYSKKLNLNYKQMKEIRKAKLNEKHREPELFLSIIN